MIRLMLLASLFVDASIASRCKCGEASIGRRIIGGHRAKLGENPWQVKLDVAAGGDLESGYICGGSIINEWTILTAAHCAVDDNNNPVNADQVTVIAGTVKTGSRYVKSSMRHAVDEVIVHAKYRPDKDFKNDIALLRLSSPLDFGNEVRAVCLADEDTPVDDVNLYLSGYGETESGDVSDNQLEAEIQTRTDEDCKEIWGSNYNAKKQLCAMSATSDACSGDSGGPLTSKSDGRFFQVGLVSFGLQKCLTDPTVFTRVSAYRGWIEDHLDHPLCI